MTKWGGVTPSNLIEESYKLLTSEKILQVEMTERHPTLVDTLAEMANRVDIEDPDDIVLPERFE